MQRWRGIGVAVTVVTGSAVMVALVLAPAVVPPWEQPGWLVPGALLAPVLYLALAVAAGLYVRAHRDLAAPPQPKLYPRMRILAVSIVVYAIALAYVTLAAQPVLAASALGPHPAHSSGVAACGRCTSRVTFTNAGGGVDTGSLAGSGSISGGQTLPLVYDRAHPDRVMTLSDYRAGRAGSALWALLAASAVAVGWTIAVVHLVRRRRRVFGALRPGTPIVGASKKTRSRGQQVWRVTFADGVRADYLDNAVVRTALHQRLLSRAGHAW